MPHVTAPHPTLRQYVDSDADRQPFVTDLFNRVAPHYDRICGVMSFGSGLGYRREALERSGLCSGMRVLDVAIGTGLVARAARQIAGPSGRVIGLDPSAGMLAQAAHLGHAPGAVSLVQGFGEMLPFASARFDFLSMGYALRHVAHLETAFVEYRRVLRPGGRLLLLEITRPDSRLALAITRVYFRRIVPALARLVARTPEAALLMKYYWDTIDACVPPETILAALVTSGFTGVERRVVRGIFSEYVARK